MSLNIRAVVLGAAVAAFAMAAMLQIVRERFFPAALLLGIAAALALGIREWPAAPLWLRSLVLVLAGIATALLATTIYRQLFIG